MSFWSCVEKPKLNWRPSCSKGREKKKFCEIGKKSLCPCPLEDPEGTEEVYSSILNCRISTLSPSFFLVVIDSWLTPEGLGPHFMSRCTRLPLSLFLLWFFFLNSLEPFWWGRLVMVCRLSRMFEEKEDEIVAYVLWFVVRMSSQVCQCFDYANPVCCVFFFFFVELGVPVDLFVCEVR